MEKRIKKEKMYEYGNLKCYVTSRKKNFNILDDDNNIVAEVKVYNDKDNERIPSSILKINDSLHEQKFDKITNQEIMKIFSDICRENNLRIKTICTGKGGLGIVDDYIIHYPLSEKHSKSYVSEELPCNIKGEYFLISNNINSIPYIVSAEQRDLMVNHNIDIFAYAPKFMPYSTKKSIHDKIIPYYQRSFLDKKNYISLNNPKDMENSRLFESHDKTINFSRYDIHLNINYDLNNEEKELIVMPIIKTDNEGNSSTLTIKSHEIRDKKNPFFKNKTNNYICENGVFDLSKINNIKTINFSYYEKNNKNLSNQQRHDNNKKLLKNIADSLITLNDNTLKGDTFVTFNLLDEKEDIISKKFVKKDFLKIMNEKQSNDMIIL